MTYHRAFFNVKTARIQIIVPVYDANNDIFVRTEEFRNFPSFSHANLSDWKIDTSYLCQELSKTQLDYQDYLFVLFQICQKHIKQFGRLIDSDLFNYIDELLLIIKGIIDIDGPAFPLQQGQQAWLGFKDEVFQEFQNHIWVNKFSSNPLEKTQLVRLIDFYA